MSTLTRVDVSFVQTRSRESSGLTSQLSHGSFPAETVIGQCEASRGCDWRMARVERLLDLKLQASLET